MRRPISIAAVAALLIVGAIACTHAPVHDDPPSYREDYYYYPHVGVYFHLYSGDYYYRDGPTWTRVRVLPSHIFLDHRVRRAIVVTESKPYKRHKAHRERYKVPYRLRRDRKHDWDERLHNHKQHLKYSRRLARKQRIE